MERTLLLFDIDGTLMKSGGAGMRAMFHVGDQLFGKQFNWEGIEAGGHLDPLIFAEAAANNGLDTDPAHHQRFHDAYIKRLAHEFEQSQHLVEIMPGIHQILSMLHERQTRQNDIVLGLLTGNYTLAVPIKLKSIGVDPSWFNITAFGDEAPSRPDLVAVAMNKYQAMTGHAAHPHGVIVIGDTPRDIACAHAHGARVLAVGTGGYELAQLQACKADAVAADLSDPSLLLEMIAKAATDVKTPFA